MVTLYAGDIESYSAYQVLRHYRGLAPQYNAYKEFYSCSTAGIPRRRANIRYKDQQSSSTVWFTP